MKQPQEIDRDYLRRCKESSPEQRLDWLAAAVDFAQECARASKERTSQRTSL